MQRDTALFYLLLHNVTLLIQERPMVITSCRNPRFPSFTAIDVESGSDEEARRGEPETCGSERWLQQLKRQTNDERTARECGGRSDDHLWRSPEGADCGTGHERKNRTDAVEQGVRRPIVRQDVRVCNRKVCRQQ